MVECVHHPLISNDDSSNVYSSLNVSTCNQSCGCKLIIETLKADIHALQETVASLTSDVQTKDEILLEREHFANVFMERVSGLEMELTSLRSKLASKEAILGSTLASLQESGQWASDAEQEAKRMERDCGAYQARCVQLCSELFEQYSETSTLSVQKDNLSAQKDNLSDYIRDLHKRLDERNAQYAELQSAHQNVLMHYRHVIETGRHVAGVEGFQKTPVSTEAQTPGAENLLDSFERMEQGWGDGVEQDIVVPRDVTRLKVSPGTKRSRPQETADKAVGGTPNLTPCLTPIVTPQRVHANQTPNKDVGGSVEILTHATEQCAAAAGVLKRLHEIRQQVSQLQPATPSTANSPLTTPSKYAADSNQPSPIKRLMSTFQAEKRELNALLANIKCQLEASKQSSGGSL